MTVDPFHALLHPADATMPGVVLSRLHSRSRMAGRIFKGALLGVLIGVGLTSTTSGAWAYWPGVSTAGASAATTAMAASMPVGPKPTVTVSGSTLIVRWAAVTFSDGTAVTGYKVNVFNSSGVAQTVTGECAGVLTNLGCIDQSEAATYGSNVSYSITPVFATNWVGTAGATTVGTTAAATSTNNVWMWVTP